MKKKYIKRWRENKSRFNESQGEHGVYQFLIRVLLAVDNSISLELVAKNNPNGGAFVIFFNRERSDQLLCYIDPDRLISRSTGYIKAIPDIVDIYHDYVVIGSSFCALALIEQILKNNPKKTFLVFEKGSINLTQHYQHCPLASPPGEVECRPWIISTETTKNEFLQNVHGPIPFVGGRSTYWSGWSPIPSDKELAGWPEDLKTLLKNKYFGLAADYLGVIKANNIVARENNKLLYGTFQSRLKQCFDSAADLETVEQVIHAPLAMGNSRSIKFSTTEKLLSMPNVTMVLDCTVERILHNGEKAIALQTNKLAYFPLENSKLILAMSTLPGTTLVLNSFETSEFPQLNNVGKRFSAHLVSSIIARVPRKSLMHTDVTPDVELGAVYIAGMNAKAQYHLQLSGLSYKQRRNKSNINEIYKKYSANSIHKDCIDTSNDFIIVSCSTLGELDYKNKNNGFHITDNDRCLTQNGKLTFHCNDQDKELWDLMDSVTFKVMKKLSSHPNEEDLEYWHEADKTWKKDKPLLHQIRSKSLVHDSSTMWIGDEKDTEAPVGPDYRLRGVNNVYVTGGGLWPTGGSWNPVLTIVAMAMNLADTLCKNGE